VRVLSAAVDSIAGLWQLSNVELGAVIDLSAPPVSRLRVGRFTLDPDSTPFERAQHLLRLFRSLDCWLGHDDCSVRSWLTTRNLDLEARPIDLLANAKELLRTKGYVDALRSRA
jgi:hypothetical protein